MPGCVLRADGPFFDIDRFLAISTFQPCVVYRRGQRRSPESSRVAETNGFNVQVSQDDDCVPEQIRAAAAFLQSSRDELRRLADWVGVDSVFLDFGWDFPYRRAVAQFNHFPPELLLACGNLGIGIEVSVYAASNEES